MATRSTDIGKVAHAVSTTKITHAPGGKQSFNLFQDQNQDVIAQPTRRVRAPPGGSSSKDNVLVHPEIENAPPSSNISTMPSSEPTATEVVKKSSRVAVAPGGNSSVCLAHEEFVPSQAPPATRGSQIAKSSIFSDESEPATTKFSTRIHTFPGRKSAMGSVLNHEQGETLPVKKKSDPQQKSNIFSEEPVQFKSSTKRILAPGGQSNITFAAEENQENGNKQLHSFHTARNNQSKNLFDLSPPEKSRRPANPFKNKSSNVINLTPKAENRTLPRTGKALEESRLKEEPKPVCWARYATHNKMMQSNIFGDPPAEEPMAKRSSVRLSHQPAGGASSNIFS